MEVRKEFDLFAVVVLKQVHLVLKLLGVFVGVFYGKEKGIEEFWSVCLYVLEELFCFSSEVEGFAVDKVAKGGYFVKNFIEVCCSWEDGADEGVGRDCFLFEFFECFYASLGGDGAGFEGFSVGFVEGGDADSYFYVVEGFDEIEVAEDEV